MGSSTHGNMEVKCLLLGVDLPPLGSRRTQVRVEEGTVVGDSTQTSLPVYTVPDVHSVPQPP